uniref:TonB-dependent receptor plug domain-containing protein n=3 Tax=Flavobacterium sp. TaxID=239 RepID=UPI00404A7726
MKNYIIILFIFVQSFVFAQNDNSNLSTYFQNQQSEKVYVHLNNVLYLPQETVFFKIYITQANNKPTFQSDFVYVEIYDSSNKKITTQTYLIEQGSASGSFIVENEFPAGLYKIKAYTKLQNFLNDAVFEKEFFVQKVITPDVFMQLDFLKKSYGAGDFCEFEFNLKNKENTPIPYQNFDVDIFIDGKIIQSLPAKTNAEGKSILKFQLPQDLNSNDGLVNVKVFYNNQKESISKSIPIVLNHVDLQFLPESGNHIENQTANIFFIAKNEFGKPMDISGFIEDTEGNMIQNFTSTHDGMGKFTYLPEANKQYRAVLTKPFASKTKFLLPKPLIAGFAFSANLNTNHLNLDLFATMEQDCQILVRNSDKVHFSKAMHMLQGENKIQIDIANFPMGSYAISMVVKDKIVAERLIFINYEPDLQIEIKTDKDQYKPREKVKVRLQTKDKSGLPIASNLSVSVVDEKLLSYIDDKQHNILSWLFLGNDLKGKIHEPSYYFNEQIAVDKRLVAIDLLLNTHGWRRFSQEDFNLFDGQVVKHLAERKTDIEGFVLNHKNKPKSLDVFLFTDDGKVYKTRSDENGYFKFTRTFFNNKAILVVESNRIKKHTITNSLSNFDEFIKIKDSLGGFNMGSNNKLGFAKPVVIPENLVQIKSESINLKESSNFLEGVIVSGYASAYSKIKISTVNHVVGSLAGAVAGVNIATASGQPAQSTSIVVRGAASIYGNRASSQPLIIIDGIPSNESIISTIPPEMIQSITVLKSTEALNYGFRGMNGVIVISTNKSSSGNGILLGKRHHYSFLEIQIDKTKNITEADEFYIPIYETIETEIKTDFRNCIYWNAVIQTNNEGQANFEFFNADESTSYSILAEGTSYKGNLGKQKLSYVVKEPLQFDLKVPLFVSQNDVIKIPLWMKNDTEKAVDFRVYLSGSEYYEVSEQTQTVSLDVNESKVVYFDVTASKVGEKIKLPITITNLETKLKILKEMDVYRKGFPVLIDISGTGEVNTDFKIELPLENSIRSDFSVITNPFSSLSEGLEKMLREPHGCFEQVSSTNYPNIMTLKLIQTREIDDEVKQKAIAFLENGYKKLINYESKEGGFEWYGGNPGHEALTAYGLLQFHEMKEFIKIDEVVFNRSVAWLLSRKDGKGGFKQKQGKYGFSPLSNEVNNAYILYVLSEINAHDIKQEYEKALADLNENYDPYRAALLALTAHNLNDLVTYKKLISGMLTDISKSSLKDIKIQQTIINTSVESRKVEFASLFALALLKEESYRNTILHLLEFIQPSMISTAYGSTQSRVLAMKAFVTFSSTLNQKLIPVQISASINNQIIDTNSFDAAGNVFLDVSSLVHEGNNTCSFKVASEQGVPFNFEVKYESLLPQNSSDCLLDLSSKLLQDKIKVSETTRLEIKLKNLSDKPVNNPLVRIGIPGGTSPEPWQLKELVEKEIVDYYEIFESELVFYFRSLNGSEVRNINLDLKAVVPGSYQGIASSAYLYYDNEAKIWNSGLKLEIETE